MIKSWRTIKDDSYIHETSLNRGNQVIRLFFTEFWRKLQDSFYRLFLILKIHKVHVVGIRHIMTPGGSMQKRSLRRSTVQKWKGINHLRAVSATPTMSLRQELMLWPTTISLIQGRNQDQSFNSITRFIFGRAFFSVVPCWKARLKVELMARKLLDDFI